MGEGRTFYTYRQTIGPYSYIGKGCHRRYLDTSSRTRGRRYRNAVGKYGLTSSEIIRYHTSEAEAFLDERRLIAEAWAKGERLLNQTEGGEGASGYRHDEETKRRISQVQRARNFRDKQSIRQKFLDTMNAKATEEMAEIRRKQSEANKGRPKPPFSDEHRKNLSLAHLGKPPANKGVPKPREEIARRTATRRANKAGAY